MTAAALTAAIAVLSGQVPADLKWLAGSWRAQGPQAGQSTEEVWTYSEAGLVGLFREVVDGKPVFYELSSISLEGDKLILLSRMFDRSLKDAKMTPGAPLRFSLEKKGFHTVVFRGEGSNKASLTYSLINPHRLQIKLDRGDGAPAELFDFHRFFL